MMVCTNEACPYKRKPCHEECFESYEDHLIRVLSGMGSARGWTDAQRRANLWEKKGQSLIAKMCRCRCGLGTTKKDQEFHYHNKGKPVEDVNAQRKKNKKEKNLPALNYPLQRGPTANGNKLPAAKKVRARTESSTSSLDEAAFMYRRPDVHLDEYVRGEKANRSSQPPIRECQSNGYSKVFAHTPDHDDTISEVFSEASQVVVEVVPAPLPPRQTRSYASAIKNAKEHVREEEEHDSGHDSKLSSVMPSPVIPSPKAEDDESKSETVSRNQNTAPTFNFKASDFATPRRQLDQRKEFKPLALSIFDDEDNNENEVEADDREIDDREDVPCSITEVEAKTELLLPPEMEELEILLPVEYIPHWDPLLGRGFGLAEMMLANSHLPGMFCFC